MNYKILQVDDLAIAVSGDPFYTECYPDEVIPKGYIIKQIFLTYGEYGSKKYTLLLKKWWEVWK